MIWFLASCRFKSEVKTHNYSLIERFVAFILYERGLFSCTTIQRSTNYFYPATLCMEGCYILQTVALHILEMTITIRCTQKVGGIILLL